MDRITKRLRQFLGHVQPDDHGIPGSMDGTLCGSARLGCVRGYSGCFVLDFRRGFFRCNYLSAMPSRRPGNRATICRIQLNGCPAIRTVFHPVLATLAAALLLGSSCRAFDKLYGEPIYRCTEQVCQLTGAYIHLTPPVDTFSKENAVVEVSAPESQLVSAEFDLASLR